MKYKLYEDENNRNEFVSGTYKIGYIGFKPSYLVKKFGPPMHGDGFKVSGEYVFESEEGNPITVYDWKYTTLYDEDNEYTAVGFWMLDKEIRFNVGGKSTNDYHDFYKWIRSQ